MKIFHAVLLIGIIALISLSAVFSGAMFSSMFIEGNSTAENLTLGAHEQVSAWIYVIAAIMIIALLVVTFKLWHL
jgi:uncharacterized membrane protein